VLGDQHRDLLDAAAGLANEPHGLAQLIALRVGERLAGAVAGKVAIAIWSSSSAE
jgi:hypothetical protein